MSCKPSGRACLSRPTGTEIPAGISVPVGLDKQALPLGLQLIGQPFGEEALLGMAEKIEQAAGFDARPDVWWK